MVLCFRIWAIMSFSIIFAIASSFPLPWPLVHPFSSSSCINFVYFSSFILVFWGIVNTADVKLLFNHLHFLCRIFPAHSWGAKYGFEPVFLWLPVNTNFVCITKCHRKKLKLSSESLPLLLYSSFPTFYKHLSVTRALPPTASFEDYSSSTSL